MGSSLCGQDCPGAGEEDGVMSQAVMQFCVHRQGTRCLAGSLFK